MSQEQDKIFFRNYSIVIGLLAVFLFFSFVLAQFVGVDDEKAMKQREAFTAQMTEPEGSVSVEGVDEAPELEEVAEEATEVADAAPKSGEEVYNGMCKLCHSVPGIGAPVVGNVEEWAERIAQGNDVLYDHAINGFMGATGMMPARGGGNFTDEEVKAAVDYMVAQSQ